MDFFSLLFAKLIGGSGSNEPNGIPIPVKPQPLNIADNIIGVTSSVEEGKV